MLHFERELGDMELGSFALGQSRCTNTEGKGKLFLVETYALWDGAQQLDLGDDVRGDRVWIVFGTQPSSGEGDRIISRSMRRGSKAVEHYPAALCVEDIVPRKEGRTEGRKPGWAEERVYVRESGGGVEIVLCA